MGACQRERLLLRVAEADPGHVGVAPRDEGQQHRAAVHVEEDAVDGFDLDGGRMDVAHLGQTPAGGVVLPLFRRQGGLQLLPAGLGRSQRMIAIAHGQCQGRCALGLRILGVEGLLTAQPGQCGLDLGQQGGVFHGPSGDVAAALHQLALIQLFQRTLVRADRLDEGAAGVVGQHHDMGRLQRRPPTHGHTGRDALGDGALAGPDGRAAALLVAVGLKVDLTHKALPHPSALLGALDVDEAVHGAGQHIPAVGVHRGVDALHALGRVLVPEENLRQDEAQGAGAAAHSSVCPLPVGTVAGKLVTGHTAPLFQRDVLSGQQDVGRTKAGCRFHGYIPHSLYDHRQRNRPRDLLTGTAPQRRPRTRCAPRRRLPERRSAHCGRLRPSSAWRAPRRRDS